MPKVVIIIPTYDRAKLLQKLLLDIEREMPEATVYVFNDGSTMKYSLSPKVHYRKMLEHCGKQKFWKLVTYMWTQIKPETFDYCFFLPDDVRLKEGMFAKCVEAYEALKKQDERTICLSTGYANGRAYKACWTRFNPILTMAGQIPVLKTQWNDMCFMAERKFFDVLNWHIPFIHPDRWKVNRRKSSGVGKHITETLHSKGYSMYHLEQTQVIFSNSNKSMMQKT